MGWLQSAWESLIGSPHKTVGEGEAHGAPYVLPISRGYLGTEGESWNWWQRGYDVKRGGRGGAMVEACIAAYAQTVAMCPGNHWKLGDDNGRVRQKGQTSALARLLRRPNAYQSISDLLLQQVSHLFFEGASYSLGIRNARNEIVELHQFDPRKSKPLVGEDGSVFYSLQGNPLVERMLGGPVIAPARDVLHIRLFCPDHPLVGVTPLTATVLQAAAADGAMAQQVSFFRNQSRPSFVLTTDQVLTKEQVKELRERWDDQSRGLQTGGTPILTAGLKPSPISVNAADMQLIETLKMSDRAIATALRVPLVLVGLEGGAAPMASTETMMQFWLASGLGFVLNHIEEAYGLLFGLSGQPEEYVEFDVGALLRPAYKDRIEALARAVQGGILSPNEAREDMERPRVAHGDEPRVQQQMVPLSAWAKTPTPQTPGQPGAPPAPGTDPNADPNAETDPAAEPGDGAPDEERGYVTPDDADTIDRAFDALAL